MQPERINVDCLLVLELESPLATVLVLRVFPLGTYALLEKMVIGLECQVGCWSNVVLEAMLVSWAAPAAEDSLRRCPRTPRLSQMR